ncbi:MAG: cytochrome c3 family protein [Deltaproteobacteria bacterium]|nr:cytochrome c3 family protein [Deltaproteobacteria bacterium]
MSQADPNHKDHQPAADNRYAGLLPLTLFLACVAAYVSLLIGWELFPRLLYAKHEQPIDFNHALHVDQLGDCEGCHWFREDGGFSGIPGNFTCTECHMDAIGYDPEEIKFVEQYVYKDREVDWYVYSRQPDCVFFSHAAHVLGGEISCETCHGDHGYSEHLRPYYENRITGYSRDIWGEKISGIHQAPWEADAVAHTDEEEYEQPAPADFTMPSMKMDDCAACHYQMKGVKREGCFVCHK